jgi:transposase
MFYKIDRKKKQAAVTLNARGLKEQTAANACGISERTLMRSKSRYRKFGDIEGGGKKRGRPSIWIPAFKDVLLAFIRTEI